MSSPSLQPLPDPEALPQGVLETLDTLRLQWRALAATPGDLLAVVAGLEGRSTHDLRRFPEFEHPLSEHLMSRAWPVAIRLRAPAELAALSQAREVFDAASRAGFADLATALERTAELAGQTTGIREGRLTNRSDRRGDIVEYPPSEQVRPALAALGDFLARHRPDRPELCAVVALATICRIHPFLDGNGRTARIWFNLLMSSGERAAYLPIFELSQLSRGGYLICLRLAQQRGDWEPLTRLLARFTGWTVARLHDLDANDGGSAAELSDDHSAKRRS